MISKDTRFLIVGLGLIGGSYAMGLKKKGYHVDAIDIDPNSIAYAIQHGIIDHGSSAVLDFIGEADFIVSGMYPKTLITWISTYQNSMKKNAIITDVSGVKCKIIPHIQEQLRDDIEFLASHPMAGKEVNGVQNADNTMFHIANFIITPTKKNSNNAIEKLKAFAHILGFSNISILNPEQHDKMIAFVSQLTHVIAVSLMNANDNSHLATYTGDSFRDLTRIASIHEHLWSELFFLNKDNLIYEIDAFLAEINNFKKILMEEDVKELKKLLIESTKRRKQFDEESRKS